MNRLLFSILLTFIAIAPVRAATGLSSVIFTNLNKKSFTVDLSLAPTNMVKVNLNGPGSPDGPGDIWNFITTFSNTNANNLWTNSAGLLKPIAPGLLFSIETNYVKIGGNMSYWFANVNSSEFQLNGTSAGSLIDIYKDDNQGYFHIQSTNNGITLVTGLDPDNPDGGDSNYAFDTSITHTTGNILEVRNNTVKMLTVAAASGYSGTGTLVLTDDGTFKAVGGGGSGNLSGTLTSPFYPRASGPNSLVDGAFYAVSTNAAINSHLLFGAGGTNELYRAPDNALEYTNGLPIVRIKNSSANLELGVSSGIPIVTGDIALELFGGAAGLVIDPASAGSIYPVSGKPLETLGNLTKPFMGGLILYTNVTYTDDGSQLLRNGVPISGGGGSSLWYYDGANIKATNAINLATVSTNGSFYSGNYSSIGSYWFPDINDTFIGIHNQAVGQSDTSTLYIAAIDGVTYTNAGSFRATVSSTATPSGILSISVSTNGVGSRFQVNLQPDQSVANITLMNKAATNFFVADSSGYAGGGTKALMDDGTFKVAGTTINPTDGYVPYRSGATTFLNSPWFRITTNSVGFASTNFFITEDVPRANTFIGQGSGNLTASGLNDVMLGKQSGKSLTSGDQNVGVGVTALTAVTTGAQNVGIGTATLAAVTTSSDNTAGGHYALNLTTGKQNTAWGSKAGITNTIGESDTFIGYNSNPGGVNLTNAMSIGANTIVTNNNEIVIGNASNTKAYLPAQVYAGGVLLSASPGGGGANMTNSGASVVGYVPVYTDTSGTQLTPTNAISLDSLTLTGAGTNAFNDLFVTNTLATSGDLVNAALTTNVWGALAGKLSTQTNVAAANPTGTIGLTAVNGSAATFMRSDAAPALGAIAEGTLTHAGTATLSFASVYTKSFLSLTGSLTIAFSGVAADHDYRLRVFNGQATNITLTFPSGINTTTNWVGGAPSTTMAAGTEAFMSMTVCGGTADGNVKCAWGLEQ